MAPGCHSTSPPSLLRKASRKDEQVVGQAVEIGGSERVQRLDVVRARPRARSARRTMVRARWSAATAGRAAGKDEASSGSRFSFIASISCSRRSICAGDDAQRAVDLAGRGDVGAKVEQLVLDASASRRDFAVFEQGSATPIAPLASSTSPIAAQAHARLGDARAVGKPISAAVAGARVDLVELDQGWPPSGSSAGEEQDQDHDDDRDRLEQDPPVHPFLRLLAGQVLARRHRHDSADEDVDHRRHGQREAG